MIYTNRYRVRALARSPDAAGPGDGQLVQQCHRFLGVGCLTWGNAGGEGATTAVGHSVHFGGQSSAGATQALAYLRLRRGKPSLRAPAACWCARTVVESICARQPMSSSASARVSTWARSRAQAPSAAHSRNRSCTVFHGLSFGQVTPGRAGALDPHHAVDHLPVIAPLGSALGLDFGFSCFGFSCFGFSCFGFSVLLFSGFGWSLFGGFGRSVGLPDGCSVGLARGCSGLCSALCPPGGRSVAEAAPANKNEPATALAKASAAIRLRRIGRGPFDMASRGGNPTRGACGTSPPRL
jgi:hypothetical protein